MTRPHLSRRRFAALGGAALTTLAFPTRAQNRERRVFVDAARRQVSIPTRIQRVFTAGPPASILLYTLAPDLMIGWSREVTPEEAPFIPPRYAALPGLGRLTGRGNTANVEVVLAARPDLIMDYGSIAPTFASLADRVQEQTGVPYILIDGSFGAMENAFIALGDAVGAPQRAAELAAATRDVLARVDAVRARAGARRPRVYFARGPKGLVTGLAGSINVESLDRVGAVNVAGEPLGPGGLANVSLEQVLAWNPDTIVTVDENFHREVGSDLSWRGVAAVRDRRIFLSPGLPFGWVDSPPSVNRLIGLLWLASVLYPGAYGGDLKRETIEFYTRFYHRRPEEALIERMLRDSGGVRL